MDNATRERLVAAIVAEFGPYAKPRAERIADRLEAEAPSANDVDRVKAAMLATETDVVDWHDDPLTELAIAAIKAARQP